jgi:hypothetical protein
MIAIDWGGYDYDNLQVENALTLGGCELFISQLGGAGTPKLLKRAKAIGYPLTGGYYWNSALKSVVTQVDECSRLIDEVDPDIIILDFEHYWAKWQQYWDAIGGLLPWAEVERMNPQKISENGRLVSDGVYQRWKGKGFLDYSAQWYVNGYCPQASLWLKEKPFHVAAYPDYGLKPYSLTWDQIKAGKFMELKAGLQNVADYRPSMPAGMTDWDLWQYSSRIKAPGEYYAYDWNYFPGTVKEFRVKVGMDAATPPEIVPMVEERLTALETRVTALEARA